MNAPFTIAADLARVIFLFRDQPGAREEQRAAFRLLVSDLGVTGLALQVDRDRLILNDIEIPPAQPGSDQLREHLLSLGIGEIRFPAGLMTSNLLSAVRVLAASPGTYGDIDHLVARMDSAGAGMVQIFPPAADSLADLVPIAEEQLPPVPQGVERVVPPPLKAAAAPPVPAKPAKSPAPPSEAVPRTSKSDDSTLKDLGPDAVSEASVGMMHFVTLEMKAVGSVDELVSGLEGTGSGKKTADLLNELVAAGEFSAHRGDWPALLRAAAKLVELDDKGKGSDDHRSFGIALRRLMPRSVLEQIAKLATTADYKTDAVAVLRRMGADSTEVLLGLLTAAPTMGERRAYFSALTHMTEGASMLIHMLGHDQWFVVRNVAELCGELHLEAAVPRLAKHMSHSDERVRRAAAGALAKIGGPNSMEPLRLALRDSSPVIRLEAAKHLDGKKARGLAMTLAVTAEGESKPDVQREMLLALGRIASPEALQALGKAAEPGGKLFKRKPLALRLAAVEGLHVAGPSATNILKQLLEDEEREVRLAVQKALTTLWDA